MNPLNQRVLRHLYTTARALARKSDLDPSFIVMIALLGSLVLISVLITLLVWLRFLIAAGLVTTSAVTAVRWRRGGIEGSRENAAWRPPALNAVDLAMLECDLDVAEPD